LFKLPWTYQSQANVVFLASKNSSKIDGGNPYLAFNSTLNQTADVIRYEVNALGTSQALAARGYSSSYIVIDAQDTAGPILLITVTGNNKTSVEHTLYGVTQQVSTDLSQQQAGIGSDNMIRAQVINSTPLATRLTSKKSRPLSIVFGLGIALTIGIPLIIDAILLRRRGNVDWRADHWTPNGQKDNWLTEKWAEAGKFAEVGAGKYADAAPDVTMPIRVGRDIAHLSNDQGQGSPDAGNLSEPQGDSSGSELLQLPADIKSCIELVNRWSGRGVFEINNCPSR
jgi:hypothetical protein